MSKFNKIGDKKYDRELQDLLNIINENLALNFNNVFIFLKSAPIVE